MRPKLLSEVVGPFFTVDNLKNEKGPKTIQQPPSATVGLLYRGASSY